MNNIDKEIISTRVFNADQQSLFKAWSDPFLLQQWWGPKGFTNTFLEYNFKEGGRWRFVMHGPDGSNYPNECEFVKFNKPEYIIWNHLSNPPFQVAVYFENLGEKTKVIFKMIFSTEEECRQKKIFVVDKNEENFDRLETVLAKMQL